MGGRRAGLTLVISCAVLVLWSVPGQVSAAPDCDSEFVALDSCLTFVMGEAASPGNSCCSPLASVESTDPVCLCELLGYENSSSLASINVTLARMLPGLCNVTANEALCPGLLGAPTASPTTSPGNAPSPGRPASSNPGVAAGPGGRAPGARPSTSAAFMSLPSISTSLQLAAVTIVSSIFLFMNS